MTPMTRRALKLGLLATTSFGALAAFAAPAMAGPLLFPLIAPLLGSVGIFGASIGLSVAATTALVTAVSYGIQAAIGFGLNYLASSLFGPKAPRQPKPEDRQVMVREPTPTRRRSYGREKLGASLAYVASKAGSLYRVMIFGDGPIDAIEEFWIDDVQVTVNPTTGAVTDTRFAGHVSLFTRLGTADQTAFSELVAAIPTDWTTNHRGRGIATVLMVMNPISPQDYSDVYNRGEPNLRVVLRGAQVFDPRDVTQVWSDRDTWKWSRNAALVILDYLTYEKGARIPRRFFENDLDWWKGQADICDQPIPLAAGGTTPRWTLDYTYDYDMRPADVLAVLLGNCDGRMLRGPGGSLRLQVGYWEDPTVIITDAMISSYTVNRGLDVINGANVFEPRFTSAEHDYQATETDEWVVAASVAKRGRIPATMDLFATRTASQATALVKLASARANPDHVLDLSLNLGGMALMGKRFVRVDSDELGITGNFEVTGDPEFMLGEESVVKGLRVKLSSITAEAYARSAAEELPVSVAVPPIASDNAVPAMAGLAVTTLQEVVAGGAFAAFARISWTDPNNASLTPEIRIRKVGEGDDRWINLGIQAGQFQTRTGVLEDGVLYEVQGRFVSGTGRRGTWSASVQFTAVADTVAPAAVTSVTLGVSTTNVSLSFTTPNDVHFTKVRIYRNTTNNPLTATMVLDVQCARSVVQAVVLPNQPYGTQYYWVAASNASNIEAVRVAPTPASVVVIGPELVTTGDFASGTGWTPGTDWSIASGVASKVAGAASSSLTQAISLTAGGSYEATFTVTARTAGTVTPRFTGGTTVTGTARSSVGTFTETLVAASGNTTLEFLCNSVAALSIDTVSVKRIA